MMGRVAFKPLNPKTVLGVAAHPDDLEFGIAGAIAKWSAAGADCYYLILTNGNKGSEDRALSNDELRNIRRREQRAAGKIIGLKDIFFCDYEDGLLTGSIGVKRDIIRIIRKIKPDVVLTMDPTFVYDESRGFINHPDHRAAGQATLDAVYPLARDWRSFPELESKEKLPSHKVKTVLLNNFKSQNYFEDISEHIETKLAALAAHASQLPNPPATLKMVKKWSEIAGLQAGCRYAEGFLRIDLAE
jgi:LmbE family N-acetylglucosaminyl deacetylase